MSEMLYNCLFILLAEDGLRARWGTSVRLRSALMGGGIRSFSEKLHETGDGTFREHHAVLRELREDRVSELCEVLSRPNRQNVAQESEEPKIPELGSCNDPTVCAMIARTTVQNGNFRSSHERPHTHTHTYTHAPTQIVGLSPPLWRLYLPCSKSEF